MNSNLVILPVTVKDHSGELVPDLKRDEFRVFEDNVEQHVDMFTAEAFPLSMVVLIDNDLKDKDAEKVQGSLLAILGGLATDDEAFICRFDQFFHPGKGFTNDQDKLSTELKRTKLDTEADVGPSSTLRLASSSLPLNDAIVCAVCSARFFVCLRFLTGFVERGVRLPELPIFRLQTFASGLFRAALLRSGPAARWEQRSPRQVPGALPGGGRRSAVSWLPNDQRVKNGSPQMIRTAMNARRQSRVFLFISSRDGNLSPDRSRGAGPPGSSGKFDAIRRKRRAPRKTRAWVVAGDPRAEDNRCVCAAIG